MQGQGVGVLIKRLTCVFPTMKRLEMYHQLIHTVVSIQIYRS